MFMSAKHFRARGQTCRIPPHAIWSEALRGAVGGPRPARVEDERPLGLAEEAARVMLVDRAGDGGRGRAEDRGRARCGLALLLDAHGVCGFPAVDGETPGLPVAPRAAA